MKRVSEQAQPKKERAQSMVEMALIVPILALMLLGLFEVGYAIWGTLTLASVDREATRFAIKPGALDFQEITPNEIGYNNVITHALVANAGQLRLNDYLFNGGGTPDDPRAAIIVTHIVVDTEAPCDIENSPNCVNTCPPQNDYDKDDLILEPGMPNYGYLRFTYPPTSAVQSRLDTSALAAKLKQDNDQFNCQLARKGMVGNWSKNSVVVVEMFYEQPQLLGVPLMSWILNPIPLYSQTTMRIDSQDLARCEVYPIALQQSTLNGWLEQGSEERDIWNGGGGGARGWLTWTQTPTADYLEKELKNPRLATNDYEDPTDASDTMLNVGDWIASLAGNNNTSGVRAQLDILKNQPILVPVWDLYQGDSYRVTQFAQVEITDYCLNSGNTCSYAGHPGFNGYITARLIDKNVDYACPGN